MTTQVFGPNRPAAAHAAIVELESALTAREELGGGWAPDAAHKRVTVARAVRSMYSEYGDAASALAHL